MSNINQAALFCQKNNVSLLQTLVPSQISPDAIISKIKLASSFRRNVPLLCIAIASNSQDVVQYLVKCGAKTSLTDVSRNLINLAFKLN